MSIRDEVMYGVWSTTGQMYLARVYDINNPEVADLAIGCGPWDGLLEKKMKREFWSHHGCENMGFDRISIRANERRLCMNDNRVLRNVYGFQEFMEQVLLAKEILESKTRQ